MIQISVEREEGTDEDPVRVPRGPLIAAGCVVALTFTLAIGGRYLGWGTSDEAVSVPLEERSLRFVAQGAESLDVFDARSGLRVARLGQGANGFIFGALRGASHRRRVAQVDPATPYALTRWQDGRITLDDPSTGMHVAVNSFGPTQVASFEQLFAEPAAR